MFKKYQQPINKDDFVIIGLGDSYTQGLGAYNKETWDKYGGKISVHLEKPELLEQQYKNSWVNLLANKLNCKSINLGHAGTGNRAALKELYFYPEVMNNVTQGIVVYFLSGLERFDFCSKTMEDEHSHFFAMWPNPWDENSPNKKLWEVYADDIYSDKFIVSELMLNLLEAQAFCKARGLRLIVSTAFDHRINRNWFKRVYSQKEKMFSPKKCVLGEEFIDQFDWSQFFVPEGYGTFMELLCDLEGDRSLSTGGFYKHFYSLPYPGKYVTNCVHPTVDGHKVIAEEFYKLIKGN